VAERRCPKNGKVRWPTEHAAQVALVGAVMKANRGNQKRRECRYYECSVCRGWHLTSQPKG